MIVSNSLRSAPLYMFEALDAYLMALGNDVTKKTLKLYFAFRRIKNFACVEFRPQLKHLLIFVKVDPSTINLEQGVTRDVSSIGHFGTGDLEITIASMADLERAKPLMLTSYGAPKANCRPTRGLKNPFYSTTLPQPRTRPAPPADPPRSRLQ